jgi:hypothetical protein
MKIYFAMDRESSEKAMLEVNFVAISTKMRKHAYLPCEGFMLG